MNEFDFMNIVHRMCTEASAVKPRTPKEGGAFSFYEKLTSGLLCSSLCLALWRVFFSCSITYS